MKKHRIGKFIVSNTVFKEMYEKEISIFNHFYIINCEYAVYLDVFEYTAYSNLFDEIEDGSIIPYYNIKFNNNYTITVEKDNINEYN